MKTRDFSKIWTLTIVMFLFASAAVAGLIGEYGDAPESAIAYPSLGVMGAFPTCANAGPAGYVLHGPLCWAFFGPGFDFESEGNGGACSSFNPYDQDECYGDGDAGLMKPEAWTIQNNPDGTQTVVACINQDLLGYTCHSADWGTGVADEIDIMVTNTMPVDGFVNVLADWDRSGSWGGFSSCGSAQAPEHVLVNFPLPIGFSGPLSALLPPSFLIGPQQGFIWFRFTVSETAVPIDWNGEQMFEDGETEDYLLQVIDPTATEESDWSTIKRMYR